MGSIWTSDVPAIIVRAYTPLWTAPQTCMSVDIGTRAYTCTRMDTSVSSADCPVCVCVIVAMSLKHMIIRAPGYSVTCAAPRQYLSALGEARGAKGKPSDAWKVIAEGVQVEYFDRINPVKCGFELSR